MVEKSLVRTDDGLILAQIPDDSRWGFALHDDDQCWPGGFGIASEWECVSEEEARKESGNDDLVDTLLSYMEDHP